jgi:ABC-type glycerol-3-phosphate transport system substrate-binding protein
MLPKILLGLGLFATLFSVLIFSCKIPVGNCKEATKARGDVVLWGTLPEQDMSALTQEFNPKAKTYAVRYKYVAEADFEQRLLEAIASGQGPDMIIAPYQTILAETDRIYPFTVAEKTFRDAYVDGASVLLTSSGALALPVSVEPMVLFYNRTLFSKHGVINPPTYSDEVITLAPLLTVRQGGQFVESAIALGTPTVPYAKDIIMAIVAQLGQTPVVQIVDAGGEAYISVQANEPVTPGSEILPLVTVNRFFTQFGDPGQNAYTCLLYTSPSPRD